MGANVEVFLIDKLDQKVATIPELKAATLDAAREIAQQAQNMAGSLGLFETGAYIESIRAEETRGGARVVSDDYKSSWIEFGAPGAGLPAHWVFHNAAIACGYKFKKDAKFNG